MNFKEFWKTVNKNELGYTATHLSKLDELLHQLILSIRVADFRTFRDMAYDRVQAVVPELLQTPQGKLIADRVINEFHDYDFRHFGKSENFVKASRLNDDELGAVNKKIDQLAKKGWIAKDIIKYLQKNFPKLSDKYKAERAYFTEMKRIETDDVKGAGESLDVSKYKMILSPSACKKCREFTDDGRKIFTQKGLQKNGWEVPPIHPNCYCILIPHV